MRQPKGSYRLDRAKKNIEWTQAIDPKATKVFLKKFFEKFPHNEKVQKHLKTFMLRDRALFTLSENMDEIVSLEKTRTMSSGDSKRIDRTWIEKE